MSDRVKGYTVILEHPMKDEDADRICAAIQIIRGVAKVTEHVMGAEDYMAQEMIRNQLVREMLDFLVTKDLKKK